MIHHVCATGGRDDDAASQGILEPRWLGRPRRSVVALSVPPESCNPMALIPSACRHLRKLEHSGAIHTVAFIVPNLAPTRRVFDSGSLPVMAVVSLCAHQRLILSTARRRCGLFAGGFVRTSRTIGIYQQPRTTLRNRPNVSFVAHQPLTVFIDLLSPCLSRDTSYTPSSSFTMRDHSEPPQPSTSPREGGPSILLCPARHDSYLCV